MITQSAPAPHIHNPLIEGLQRHLQRLRATRTTMTPFCK